MDKVKCSLWIWVCLCSISCSEVNVALKKNASTTSGTLSNWHPSGAVDGDNVNLTSASSCFHSNTTPADWTVDLGQEYQLYNIIVYIRFAVNHNRTFFDRIANSSIYVDNDPSKVCYTFPSTISDNPTHLTCNETARYVTIKNPGNKKDDDTLNICEVEIYACHPGYLGVNCSTVCHCDKCDRWTGICHSSCRPGWEGERCDQACSETYGFKCNNSCNARHCSNSSSSCDPVSGTCDSGCLAGWTEPDCMAECPNSTYGVKCSQMCTNRSCLGESACNHVTGSCEHGCEEGWTSVDCMKACNGTYGFNCTIACAARHCSDSSSSCDPINGTCDSAGCLAGWTGHDCISKCQVSTYGQDCSKSCTDRHCKETCNHVNGSCDLGCEPGWKSTDCTTACTAEEEFGQNCSGSCKARHCLDQSSCHPGDGSCENGCETGWEGPQCLQAVQVPPPIPGVIVIAGAAAAGVIVVLILVLLTVGLIRRKRRRPPDSEPFIQAPARKEESNQAIVYENFALQEESTSETKKIHKQKSVQVVHLAHESTEETVANNVTRRKDVKHAGKNGHVNDNKLEDKAGWEAEEDELEEEVETEIVKEYDNIKTDEKNYYNLNQVDSKHVISVSQLPQRITEMKEKQLLVQEEYEALPCEFLYSYGESQRKENKGKNRFRGYYPYDYNRVELGDTEGECDTDYINASFIDGYKSDKRFIAAQGPYKPELFEDFWRMVWQEECTAIVMVTSLVEAGKMKCLRYWPENVIDKYGRFTVTTEKIQQLADYTITNLTVQHDQHSKKKHVQHFYFTSWPDHGVPDISSLLTFMRRVQNSTQGQQQPIVVHCSAGIGRTGTYIAVESLINRAMTEGVVDVVSFVTNMRGQRRNMVQTMEQYHFIYQAVSHAVTHGDTSLTVDIIKQLNVDQVPHFKMGNKTVKEHLQILHSMKKDEKQPDGFILLPSYRKRSGFSLLSPESDNEDIWNLVFNGDVRILITDSTCKEELVSPDVDVAFTKGRKLPLSEHVNMCDVELKNKDGEIILQIQHYKVEGEMNEGTVSVLTDSLLQGTGQQEGQATALVSSSETDCGVLVLLVNLVTRLQEEGRTDIILEMTRLQQKMPHVTFNMDHIRLCLNFAQRWIESTEMYANIKQEY